MSKFLDVRTKTKLLNFLGITKKVVLKNNYMVIKVFSLKGVKNIKDFIEKNLEGQLGEFEELLIHYEILKLNKREKQIVIYILKDNGDLEGLLKDNLKVELKPIQIEKAEIIKKKLKLKTGITLLKQESNFYVMSFVKGILVNYDESNFLEDINISYNKKFLEKILKEDVKSIYISNEILNEKKEELAYLNLIGLGV